MSDDKTYRVIFNNQGKVVELYARSVGQGGLFGFVEVAELIFGTRTQVVVDPGEESLKKEFEGVERVFVPMHAIVRIDEVAQVGVSRVRSEKAEVSGVTPFPVPVKPEPKGDG